MSRSKEKNQAKLKQIYGVTFPDSLFWLHEFIVEQRDCDDSIDLKDISLYPFGVLEILLNFDDLERVEFTGDPLLHCRYYRDVPEFFTYLFGDGDGLHWGMLLDKPTDGFRGVAKYWSNDGAEMTVYNDVFDALIKQCERSIDFDEPYLREDDEYYKRQAETCQKLINRIEMFLTKNQLSRNEFRLLGLENSTGLDVISNEIFDHYQRVAVEMLKSGKELWYADGEDRSDEAFEIMKRAYELLQEHKATATRNNLFDDLIAECNSSIKFYTQVLPLVDDDGDRALFYQKHIDKRQKLKSRIEDLQQIDRLSDSQFRSLRLANNPESEIASDNNFVGDSREAILVPRGYANEMLKWGRELWYWEGKDRSTEAYDLMRKAYELLERPELIRILDVHYRDRDSIGVNFVRH